MNDIKGILNETIRVQEDEFGGDAPKVEAPVVNEELIAEIAQDYPEIAEYDKAEVLKGLQVEMEHFGSVGGDIITVAKIVCDHIREFPGKSYYTALDQMQHELAETPEEEKAAENCAREEEAPLRLENGRRAASRAS